MNLLKPIIVILFFCVVQIGFAQTTATDKAKASEEPADQEFDRDFKPAQSKNGIENQIVELKDIIKQKRKEMDDWEDIISSLKSVIDNKQQEKANIDQKWMEIERSINDSHADYKRTYEKYQDIVQYFYPAYGSGYFNYDDGKKQAVVNRFINSIASKVSELRTRYNVQSGNYYRVHDDNYTRDDINSLLGYKNIYTDSVYKLFYKDYIKIISEQLQAAKTAQAGADNYIKLAYKKIEDLNKASEDKDISINQRAINIGLPLFCGTVFLLFLIAFLYRKLNSVDNSKDSDGLISKILLEIITVLLITMTVLILGLARILSENVLGTLLGGIAGYILNRRGAEPNPGK